MALMSILLLAIAPTVVAYNPDPLWENTLGPGNQGEKAYAVTGDPWDLVAADFLGPSPAVTVKWVPVYLNNYSNGPWRISFLDYGTAHYKSWPDPFYFSISGITVWYSQIYPANGDVVDVYIFHYLDSIDNAVAEIINAWGQRQYIGFTSIGKNYGLLLSSNDITAYYGIGNSIQVTQISN